MKINFNAEFFVAQRRMECDPQGAADALLLAAQYLRDGKTMPAAMVDYLAGAIEASMGKSQEYRNASLLAELGLTNNNRRKKGDWLDIGKAFEELINSGLSQNSAKAQIAADFDISESSAVSKFKEYQVAQKFNDSIEYD